MTDNITFWWNVQDLALIAFMTLPIWVYALVWLWGWIEDWS